MSAEINPQRAKRAAELGHEIRSFPKPITQRALDLLERMQDNPRPLIRILICTSALVGAGLVGVLSPNCQPPANDQWNKNRFQEKGFTSTRVIPTNIPFGELSH